MKKLIVQFTFIVLVISMVFISGARAATTACDGSLTDCQSKVNVAADGDIITIPNGSFTWNSGLNVNLSGGRALTIKGLNACTLDANGRPTSCPTSISGTGRFNVTGANGKPWRISNMTLNGGIGIFAEGNTRNWRIDHIYFNALTLVGVWVQGTGVAQALSWGLIDHCTVYDLQAAFMHVRANLSDCGNYEWGTYGNDLGTANAVYMEDNTFVTPVHRFYASATDCEGGSFVARNNIFGEIWFEMHDAINANLRGCRKWEIYNNSFVNIPLSGQSTNMHLRSGMGVAFNNTCTNAPDNWFISMSLYRTYTTSGGDYPWNNLCGTDSGKALLDTTTNYPQNCTSGKGCVNKDGSGTGSFPCRDQIGTSGNGTQTIVPALFWNNKVNGSFVEPRVISGGDYYIKGTTYCSNASADKPTTCNGSAVTYTPYTYPHPLNGPAPPLSGPAPPLNGPAPPRNVRFMQ